MNGKSISFLDCLYFLSMQHSPDLFFLSLVFKWLHFVFAKTEAYKRQSSLPSQSPSIYTLHWPSCQPRSLLYSTPSFRASNLMSLSKLVTNTLKRAQAPPVCRTYFPSDPSRGEARVEVADTLLMPSAHYCVSVCVCACLSIDATHMADRIYVDTTDFVPLFWRW